MNLPRAKAVPVYHGVDQEDSLGYQALVDEENGRLFSIVSESFRVVQHRDLLDQVYSSVYRHPEYGSPESRVMLYNGGARMKATLTFPEVQVPIGDNGDLINPQITIRNGYDGNWALSILFGAFRLVCSNGLVIGEKALQYRKEHVHDVGEIWRMDSLSVAMDQFSRVKDIWKGWADTILTQDQAKEKVGRMQFTPNEEKDLLQEVEVSSGESLDDPKMKVITAWILFNLVCQYATHRVQSEQRRMQIESRARRMDWGR